MRYSILALIVFFILGLIFLLQLRGKKLREDVPPALPCPARRRPRPYASTPATVA